VNGVPEKGRDTTGQGRASGPGPKELCGTGSVLGPSPPNAVILTENASRLVKRTAARECEPPKSDAASARSPPSNLSNQDPNGPDIPPAKARERSEQERGGGRGATAGSELEGGSEGKGRPSAGGRNSSGGAEAVPSAGWREVAVALDAVGGQEHE
jgi:hypothetical protein